MRKLVRIAQNSHSSMGAAIFSTRPLISGCLHAWFAISFDVRSYRPTRHETKTTHTGPALVFYGQSMDIHLHVFVFITNVFKLIEKLLGTGFATHTVYNGHLGSSLIDTEPKRHTLKPADNVNLTWPIIQVARAIMSQ